MDDNKTVLVVDDDPLIRDLARKILEKHYYRTLAASSVAAATKIIDAHRPDLILLDVHLASDDGVVFLSRLKSNPILHTVPVIMLTGDAGRDLVARAMRAGAADFLIKPIKSEMLVSRIARAMQIGHLERMKDSSGAGNVQLERQAGTTRILFTGTCDLGAIEKLKAILTQTVRMQIKNDDIVVDLRFQVIENEMHIKIVRAIIEMLKPSVPRIVAGRNYGALLALDVDFETQVFLSPDDVVQFLQLKHGPRKP
ncbi:MAG: response regulator [Leptospirales bacterium]|nr:response regulator [Leptospirales bacterium]HMU82062.1 response regulator [Leptospiraceae bacterium]HMW58609.1 response regulator [Leptospiraceae bacterium]HNJ04064.1 response regulator [Leptospiraceae bacterium]HNL67860.1 response regulator [Leptospiraceae bacterium]